MYGHGVKEAGRFVVVFALCSEAEECRFGVTVTRRVGTAVTRNRARRRVRELMRWSGAALSGGVDVVINVRRGCAEAPWKELEEDFRRCLGRAIARESRGAQR